MCNSNVPSLYLVPSNSCVHPWRFEPWESDIVREPMSGRRKPAFYAMWQATGYRCWYCGIPQLYEMQTEYGSETYFDDHGLEIDHFHPRAKGGGNERTNLVPACKDCNRSKSAKSIEEFRAAEIAQYLELVPVEHQTDEPYEFAFERYGWISGAY